MTLRHPMFPPVADRARKTRSDAEQVSTHASIAQVEVSPGNGANSELANGVFETPFPAAAAPVAGDLYVRTDISPENLFQALERLRSQAGAEIERLIAFLDSLDDPDLEPSGDEREPDLAAPENHPRNCGYLRSTRPLRDATGSQLGWSAGNDDGREGDAGCDDREGDELEHGGESEREDDELSGDEDEPSLGSFDRLANQDHSWRQTLGSGANWWTRRNEDFEADAAV